MRNILKCPKCGRIVTKGTAIKNMDYWVCHNPKCEIKYLKAPVWALPQKRHLPLKSVTCPKSGISMPKKSYHIRLYGGGR